MRPLRPLTILLASAVLVVTACGDDDAATTSSATPATSAAPTTAAPETTTTQAPTTSIAPTTPPDTTQPPETTTTAAGPQAIVVEVAGGAVEGPDRTEVALGDEVTLSVSVDVADQVHVHGYDLFADVGPGEPAEITFVADIPGIFEVELESSHLLLLELEIR